MTDLLNLVNFQKSNISELERWKPDDFITLVGAGTVSTQYYCHKVCTQILIFIKYVYRSYQYICRSQLILYHYKGISTIPKTGDKILFRWQNQFRCILDGWLPFFGSLTINPIKTNKSKRRQVGFGRKVLMDKKPARLCIRSIFHPTHCSLPFRLVFLAVRTDFGQNMLLGEVGLVRSVHSLPKTPCKVL